MTSGQTMSEAIARAVAEATRIALQTMARGLGQKECMTDQDPNQVVPP